jgi:predicted glycosyltransferase
LKKVLVAPLDWGLGHATRCIPVIRELQLAGCDVLIAGSGDSLELLKKEFPSSPFITLPPYAPRYAVRKSMVTSMGRQLPRFLKAISAEHQVVQSLIKKHGIQLLISDNRYGCWSQGIPSVFITHQTNILMPGRYAWLQSIVGMVNTRMMRHFDACWIPDVPGDMSLAGDLATFSRAAGAKAKEYIGCLSRFTLRQQTTKLYDVMAIFSGPEPQRTALEKIVVPQLQDSGLRYLIVRGLPASNEKQSDPRIFNFMLSRQLEECMAASEIIISRSGYSSVMDLQVMGKKSVFIPTPGQTEQEYLAKRLMEKGIAFFMDQDKFKLPHAIDEGKKFSGFHARPANEHLRGVVRKYVSGS